MCAMVDITANVDAIREPAGVVAEAGAREAPALPPGLLTDFGEASGRPTKLFIGGISRHTTTKQLRDHFSQFGRVLDCVAMRQPDGRPRGFGYVTLDSQAAAEHCVVEPQMIDNRIVDMKLAVPEGLCSGGTSPSNEAGFGMNMFAGQADFNMGMFAGQGFNCWPEQAGNYGNGMSWWPNGKTSLQNQGLDCVDLLSAARETESQTSSPHGLPLHSVGLHDYAERGAYDHLDGSGASAKMSASAPEFVPLEAQASQKTKSEAVEACAAAVAAPAKKATRARAPLGELTNIVEVDAADLLTPFKSPTKNRSNIGHGHLTMAHHADESEIYTDDAGLSNHTRLTGLLLDDEVDSSSSPSSCGARCLPISPDTTPERDEAAAEATTEDCSPSVLSEKSIEEEDRSNEGADKKGSAAPISSTASESDGEGSSEDSEPFVIDMDALPSMGSALHGTGECKRCNFFPKGRCQNGQNCTFCHFSHDKRKPSRQEKRERRAAWLDQQTEPDQETLRREAMVVQQLSGPLLSSHGLQPGYFPGYAEEDIYSDEALSLSYSIFPGCHLATKLPAPLALPGMDMPPGLAPPTLATQPWQPEAEASPAAGSFLATGQTMFQQVVPSILHSSAPFLSTVPTPASTTASTPLVTPMATPTAASGATRAEANPVMPVTTSTATFGTQTGDYKCHQCEEMLQSEEKKEASSDDADHGPQWARDELLRLRDRLAKMSGASDTKGNIIWRTLANTASTASPM